MSSISRSSVTALPDTGTIVSSSVSQGTSTTITGALQGETWKIIGISYQNTTGDSSVMRLELIDTQLRTIELTDDLTVAAGGYTPVKTIFTTGDLLVDYNIKLQATNVSGDAEEIIVYVAYVKVN